MPRFPSVSASSDMWTRCGEPAAPHPRRRALPDVPHVVHRSLHLGRPTPDASPDDAGEVLDLPVDRLPFPHRTVDLRDAVERGRVVAVEELPEIGRSHV